MSVTDKIFITLFKAEYSWVKGFIVPSITWKTEGKENSPFLWSRYLSIFLYLLLFKVFLCMYALLLSCSWYFSSSIFFYIWGIKLVKLSERETLMTGSIQLIFQVINQFLFWLRIWIYKQASREATSEWSTPERVCDTSDQHTSLILLSSLRIETNSSAGWEWRKEFQQVQIYTGWSKGHRNELIS